MVTNKYDENSKNWIAKIENKTTVWPSEPSFDIGPSKKLGTLSEIIYVPNKFLPISEPFACKYGIFGKRVNFSEFIICKYIRLETYVTIIWQRRKQLLTVKDWIYDYLFFYKSLVC